MRDRYLISTFSQVDFRKQRKSSRHTKQPRQLVISWLLTVQYEGQTRVKDDSDALYSQKAPRILIDAPVYVPRSKDLGKVPTAPPTAFLRPRTAAPRPETLGRGRTPYHDGPPSSQ